MNLIAAAEKLARKKNMFGVDVFDLSWASALSLMAQYAATHDAHAKVSFLNANNVNILLQDDAYFEVLAHHLVLPDGIGMDMAAKLLDGDAFAANLNGTDFIPALLTYMETPRRIGLLGAKPGVLAGAIANFRKHTPWHQFIPVADGYFDADELPVILERLKEADIDILLVAMGTPLQEKWIEEHINQSHARLVFGVGALFDFVSGTVPRAPVWMRKLRCEWLYRLALEPTRLWRRYIIGIPVFLSHVLRFKWRKPAR
ncbi:WecB/TagA/CpsF family glycosyltransferase [Rhizobium oryziradicis]|uniref:UDP-N-acetyl-D-mannosaminuronic acid transferase n=1 Tax=Rhizobium oryziradicis TaxID=1867956 RepID=A0A1Q8ZV35_9HYPH|nr:WecB/TagA/CpsF family glycosyltransferase [Rhizobium oryziradicis]OLP45930.1 UDP-N-acetyl-D-mannosaminuronic acid transferase [Rhizobium oryziradicis]